MRNLMKPEPIYCCPCKATTRHVPSPEGKREKGCVICGTMTPMPIWTRALAMQKTPRGM
jgi:hypothetical protein